jgi:hypothetical protein
MPPVTIIDDEYMGLWYHPEGNIVHHKIKQYLPPGNFERLLTTGADELDKHGGKKWLSDDRNAVVVAPEDIKWSEVEWVRRMTEAGLKHWAVVLPASAVGSLQLKKSLGAPEKESRIPGLTIRTFESVEEALAWLQTV